MPLFFQDVPAFIVANLRVVLFARSNKNVFSWSVHVRDHINSCFDSSRHVHAQLHVLHPSVGYKTESILLLFDIQKNFTVESRISGTYNKRKNSNANFERRLQFRLCHTIFERHVDRNYTSYYYDLFHVRSNWIFVVDWCWVYD